MKAYDKIIQISPAFGYKAAFKDRDENDDFCGIYTENVIVWALVERTYRDDYTFIIGIINSPGYGDTEDPEERMDFLGYFKEDQNPYELWPEYIPGDIKSMDEKIRVVN